MSVRIKEINVRSLGPISQFSMKPGLLNLIYGRNEMGKTYLVEFLIRSLFRNVRQWSLRTETGQGKVSVQGLEEKDVIFSPKSVRKLDDYWDDAKLGLPPDFSKLLMVKGAEAALNESGADKSIVVHYLSGQDILSKIEKRIPVNIQKADIHPDDISGPSQGEKKSRDDKKKILENLDQLFEEIDQDYSGGQRKLLSDRKEEITRDLAELEQSKRYRAFQLSQELGELKKEVERIDEEKLKRLREEIHHYQKKNAELDRKKQDLKEAEEKSKNYTLLQEIEKTYSQLLAETPARISLLFPILALLMIIIAGLFIFLKISSGVLAALAAITVFIGLSFWQIRKLLRSKTKLSELERIKTDFHKLFKEPSFHISVVRDKLKQMEKDFNTAGVLKEQLVSEIRGIESMKVEIQGQLSDFSDVPKDTQSWGIIIKQVENRLSDLKSKVGENEKSLVSLQIDESDYLSKKPDIEYSKHREDKLRDEKKQIEEDIRRVDDKLKILEQRICDQTGDKIDTPWEKLIYNLQKKCSEVEEEYKQVTAEIIGKKAVFDVVQNLRKDEGQKILESLQSEAITTILENITGRYTKLSLKEDRLVVSSAYDNDFNLSDLSTGAQEQVMLALRIGFASKLLGKQGEPLFLILDDAFQYSDWERRERLVDTVIGLAKSNWQIIYLTMDDHIKGLFQKRGKAFGSDFQYVDLSETN
jgi:DNA repair exonuclease SbcCD ATPase subunit